MVGVAVDDAPFLPTADASGAISDAWFFLASSLGPGPIRFDLPLGKE